MALSFCLFIYLLKKKIIQLSLCVSILPCGCVAQAGNEHQDIAQKAELQSSSKKEANLNAEA